MSPAPVIFLPAVGFILFSLLLLNLTHCLEHSLLKHLAVLFFFCCHPTISYQEVLIRVFNVMIIKAQRRNSHPYYSASHPGQVIITKRSCEGVGVFLLLLLFGYKSSSENGPLIWVWFYGAEGWMLWSQEYLARSRNLESSIYIYWTLPGVPGAVLDDFTLSCPEIQFLSFSPLFQILWYLPEILRALIIVSLSNRIIIYLLCRLGLSACLTVQWFLVYSELYNYHYILILEHLQNSKKKPQPYLFPSPPTG